MNRKTLRNLTAAGTQQGFSIVELMVAMTLSLLLLAGVLSVLYTSRLTYDENTRVARLQEYARAGVELLLRDLRNAGYQGCSRPVAADAFRSTLTAPTAIRYNFATAVQGLEATGTTWSPAVDATVIGAAATGNDIIIMRTISNDIPPMRSSATMASSASDVSVTKTDGVPLAAGQPMIISDCQKATVFALTSAVPAAGTAGTLAHSTAGIPVPVGSAQTPQNAVTNLGIYAQGSLVAAATSVVYYIRNSASGSGPALWRIMGNLAPQEVIEGVERLQLQYGEDTNGDRLVDVYRNADTVTNWDNVLAVTIAVLMRSAAEEGPQAAGSNQTFNLLGTVVGPFSDRRQRIVFTTTATIRNRAL